MLIWGWNKASVQKRVFQLLVFLLPTQLAYHFWPSWSYVFGIRVDYLSPAIYLTDLLVILYIFLAIEKTKDLGKYLAVFGGLAVVNLVFSVSFFPAAFKWIKILEFFLLAYTVARQKSFDFQKLVLEPLSYSLIFFFSIGAVQFLIGRTIGGPFYLLGERSFNLSSPGIALTSFFGKTMLRAYSTFSHPNSLAGYFGAAALLLLFYRKNKRRFDYLAILIGLLGLTISFSLGALISLATVCLFYFLSRAGYPLFRKFVLLAFFGAIIFSLLMPALFAPFAKIPEQPETLFNRILLSFASARMAVINPISGIGLNNFVVGLPKVLEFPKIAWWLQPVHNIFLLVFSETGLLGLLAFAMVYFKGLRSALINKSTGLALVLVFIFLTGIGDHYWLTLEQNQLLLSLVLGLSFRKDLEALW